MQIFTLFGIFALLLLIGVPIGTSVGFAAVFSIWKYGLGVTMISRNFASGIAKFPLIAIPFFVLAGILMQKAKLAEKISNLATILVGRATGGLAIAGVLTCLFWGAVSGSGPATTAAIGLTIIPVMIYQNYDKNFSAATIAAASGLAIIIPPSIAFIIYGNVTGVSVGALFLGGIIPGIIIGLFLMVAAYFISKKRNFRGIEKGGTVKEILMTTKDAFWALLAPVIVLGGIYAGIATPTEAAVFTVFYSIFVGFFVYKTLTLKGLYEALVGTVITSAVVMFVVTFATQFSIASAILGVIDIMAESIISIAKTPIAVLLLANLAIIIAGMFLDAISIIYVFMPIFIPILNYYHIDLLFFGIIFVVALAIGQITPPVAVNLYVAANLINSNLDKVAKEVWIYVFAVILGLIFLTFFPQISLYVPVASGLYIP
ncbi:MAG: C4-dicarboxylate ABC transporter permease [Candidatus Infernicultor aquiphilus]|uniref:C4-dicarboxylate ABC transporter permease n=1 Tax=Candidatus Infernicultor aquiphilus TaxID=1805029 RepID=A0A2M7PMD6_9BACT|nr:MAG: C4-dicarboxylate ABC transporter permease [Candidatus Atribacteria bacterium CG_4_10_14_3_um_filter_34_13]